MLPVMLSLFAALDTVELRKARRAFYTPDLVAR